MIMTIYDNVNQQSTNSNTNTHNGNNKDRLPRSVRGGFYFVRVTRSHSRNMGAIFYPFSLFCEIVISLLSLQKQPNTDPYLCQRG